MENKSQKGNQNNQSAFQQALSKIKKNDNNSTQEIGRIPPQALDLEEAVLGALLLDREALTSVIDILRPEIFYKDAHKIIFQAISALFEESEPIDMLTVTNKLKTMGSLQEVGGPYFITELTRRVGTPANIEYHARIIMQKYVLRELIHVSSATIKEAFEEKSDVFELLDSAEQSLFDISEKNFRRESKDMKGLVQEAIKEIEIAKDAEGKLRGVPSGFTELDRITAGWQKTDLVVIAARPGMGKTAFALSLSRNAAINEYPVAIFSLEMGAVQLTTRLISAETEVKGEKLKKGDLKDYEWAQLNSRVRNLENAPIYIDDTPALSIFELRAKCRRLKEQKGIELIVIDYIQLMRAGDGAGNREQEISQISRSLKALAKELNVPVLVLSQLSRAVETRGGNKRPQLSDLRESGAIEQDADMVIFIYRPEYYDLLADDEVKGKGEIIIAKHRNGSLDSVFLNFIGEYIKFTDAPPMHYATKFESKLNKKKNTKNNKGKDNIIPPNPNANAENPF